MPSEVFGKNALVFGALGGLGTVFKRMCPEIAGLSHVQADITDERAVEQAIAEKKPEIVINCAAMTDVNYCEQHPDEARRVNVGGVENLSRACQKHGALLVHYSTDYALDPINVYGRTKLDSEEAAKGGIVIRTDFYGTHSWMVKAALEKKPVTLLTNNAFNPISAHSLVEATARLVQKGFRGVINVGTRDVLTFESFGRELFRALGADPALITPITELKTATPRPTQIYLDPSALDGLGIPVLTLQEDLEVFRKWISTENA